LYYEKFRAAAARLPAGLIRPGAAADPAAVAAAKAALGVQLPEAYASFLRSFDGADLFHESVVIAGVGPRASRRLADLNPDAAAGGLVFAETAAGDRFLFSPAGEVIRVREGSDERMLAGSDFARWLDATVAREQLLYGPDGEFAPDAFEPDGEEVAPRTALRQAERALRCDPGSAEACFDRGVALRRLGRDDDAMAAFARAAELDPSSPWPRFDLARTALARDPRRAAAAFREAAEREPGPAGARLLAWAARAARAAGDAAAAQSARDEALRRQPALAADLRRAVEAAVADGDQDAAEEAQRLVAAIAGDGDGAPPTVRLRLPLAPEAPPPSAPAARRPPAGPPRRPRREGPPQRHGSRRGPRR
jgi:tetratricopeptide (TPR) repeat protein